MKNFTDIHWRDYLPKPICEDFPEYEEFYKKAWEIAHDHVRDIPGMPQTPYMDEAFCDTQVWIWDTCFMGLFCKFAQQVFPGIETLKNFYSVLHEGDLLPEIIPNENEPGWTGAVPGKAMNIRVRHPDNPPLFAWVEYENALMHGDKNYIKELLYERKALQKHYKWFEKLCGPTRFSGCGEASFLKAEELGYKWRGTSSGMDNSPRGRIDQTPEKACPNNPDMYWIDAICQQALSAIMISKLFDVIDDQENVKYWEDEYQKKKNIINSLYWDKDEQFYYDIDCNDKHFYKVQTIASYWTLISGVASKEQANALLKNVSNPQKFGGEAPLISLARDDKDFSSKGKYWRGSLWLPTAYATLRGLSKYGFYKEAQEAGYKIFKHMLKTYQDFEPHTIWECYSPDFCEPGRYPDGTRLARPDFCGWSALGPISIYIEYVLGFHNINAFENCVEWAKPDCFEGKIGIRNLRFGDIITDIIAENNVCRVKSNALYTLKINNQIFNVVIGENTFDLRR